MKIAVIGAGVIGITTAYELAAQGHQVSVFERNSAAAEECSFANTGLASAGYATPWAKPGMLSHVMRHLWRSNTPLRLSDTSLADWRWLWQAKKASNSNNFKRNCENMVRLAKYSNLRMQALTQTLNLAHERNKGLMLLLRSEREIKLTQATLQILFDMGVDFKVLSAEEARHIEPAINPETALAQVIQFPDGEVGNSRQFGLLLKNEAANLGVKFHFNTTVAPLSRKNPKTIYTAQEPNGQAFEAVVVCAGAASAPMIRPLGLRTPMRLIHGYTINAATRESLDAPHSAIVDERYNIAISRLGLRIRVSGGIEIGQLTGEHNKASIDTLYRVLNDWFPGAARTQDVVQVWKGTCPMLPDGPPIIGASGVPGVWLNMGHGLSGWTQACGSASALADRISGKKAEIDLRGLGIERLHK